jgi:signal peptidase II
MRPVNRLSLHALILAVLVGCIGCDQATKKLAVAELRDTPSRSFLNDTFRLVYAENPGAFLGMGGGQGRAVQFWLFTVGVGVLLAGALVYLVLKARELGAVHSTGVALLVGGGLSNWFDRLANDGRVVDFMNLGIGGLRTGIFNVADVAIVAGAILLVLPRRSNPPATTPPPVNG